MSAASPTYSLSSLQWKVMLEPGDTEIPLPPEQVQTLVTEGLPATVPGNIYDALLAAGFIPDPFVGTNEHDLHWIGQQDWTWRAQLPELPEAENYVLSADGLDTIAQIAIDGEVVGNTDNMHRTYTFDVSSEAPGAETIEVRFTSPYRHTDQLIEELGGKYPGAYDEPYNMIRKMAANYGWDWGPTVVSSGIWRDLAITAWEGARIDSLLVAPSVDWEKSDQDTVTGTLHVKGSLLLAGDAKPEDYRIDVTLGTNEETLSSTQKDVNQDGFELTATLPNARLWWPHTLGEQPLYEARINLVDKASGKVVESRTKRVGFRTVEIVNEPAATPEAAKTEGRFGLVVNGVDTFATGWNWIPNSPLVDRVTEEDYRARLRDVKDSGADWVRVWGGGIFEDDRFYNACDELGILVWQDFPFSCAAYPETPEFEAQVRAEAEDNVERIMSHPSLGIWNGNNENFLGYESWGWEEELQGAGWGGKYYLETLPSVITELNPTTPYWPGSPYSGVPGQLDNDPNYGTNHSWEVWNRKDYSHYLDTDPTFMAEFGWQAPPAWTTLVDSLGVDPSSSELNLGSPEVLNHQKAIGGMQNLERGITEHFGSKGMESTAAWHYLSQIVQARAIATGVGHWRTLWPRCQGAFIWQINDCWPVISWAGVDVEGRRKPVWYAAKQAFQKHLLDLKPVDGKLHAFLVNQEDEPWETELTQWVFSSLGEVVTESSKSLVVEPGTAKRVPLTVTIGSPKREMLIVEAEDQRVVHLEVPDYEFDYPVPGYSAVLREGDDWDSFELTVTAGTLLRELLLQIDRVHPALEADMNPVDLVPGEEYAWRISFREGASEQDRADAIAALKAETWGFPVLASIGSVLGEG